MSVARRRLLELLGEDPTTGWEDNALLALSEVVTNAVVHTGTPLQVEVWTDRGALRIEVGDRSPHLPTRRHYALTAGTGRGLHLLAGTVDRWGAVPTEGGKVVWFELGDTSLPGHGTHGTRAPEPADDTVTVTLLNLPLLMHWAWQEHAQSLLRDHLLFALDADPDVIDTHAEASSALTLLHEQVPVPLLPDDPDALLAGTLEPGVTAARFELRVPRSSVPSFLTLDVALGRAAAAAEDGSFLVPPTQPEIREFRSWLCAEVARQAGTGGGPRPWAPPSGVADPRPDRSALRERYRALLDQDEACLATDETSTIVAVSVAVVDYLGYRSESELIGRRVLAVIPHRYHQAHIAGTTLNATNGRDQLLHVLVTVPVLRADGTETSVGMRVVPRRLDDDRRVFVAHFAI